MKNVLIPVAWPYANGPRHIGHVAGFGVPSDVFARYQRAVGNNVLMISGTDEHGTPILVQAENEGISAQELANRYNSVIVDDLVNLGLSYDLFTRTTTTNHYKTVQKMFLQLYNNGYMFKQIQQSAVEQDTGRTLPDRYIEGTCPICGYEGARGDQCDSCGNQLDPIDLIDPKSKQTGQPPKFVESEQFFLDLPALRDELGKWLSTRTNWRPNVLKFSLGLLEDIQPRAMSRDIDWGVPIPLKGWEDNPSKRLYVWFDAVIGYLSASIEWATRFGDSADAWRDFWNNTDALSYYFMGKDNITFHSQIWPAELLGYRGIGSKGGDVGEFGELQLPTEVVSSEFLSMEGKKFSSSRGVVIYVKDFLARYSPDSLRYYIIAAGPESQDSDFTWLDFFERNNNELVANWGNLVNRTLSMIAKNFGEIPDVELTHPLDLALIGKIKGGFEQVGALLGNNNQKQALALLMNLSRDVNGFITETEPFKLKGDVLGSVEATEQRLKEVLLTCATAVFNLNTMFSVFLPHSSNSIHSLFGGKNAFEGAPEIASVLPSRVEVADLADSEFRYPIIHADYSAGLKWEWHDLSKRIPIAKPSPVFVKLDESIVQEELDRMSGVED
ncbi:MAG: methionine--tRNA ligase [Candidatus Ancillula sp.]|jgi:methionyl-tRNA synthetase|nr:methionine--tRNA ligase [Candidatus Ancillula sp.]